MKLTTAMLLAAGRGKRMLHLTQETPKPLLRIKDKPLIIYHLENLAQAGINKVVINHAYLGEQIKELVGNGDKFGLSIEYSPEPCDGLETAGGIFKALPKLGDKPFITINSDIYTSYDFKNLKLTEDKLAHLVLVPNPNHNLAGDFILDNNLIKNITLSKDDSLTTYTFAGIAVYHPQLFKNCQSGRYPIPPILRNYASLLQVSGEIFEGLWNDIGTPERLHKANH